MKTKHLLLSLLLVISTTSVFSQSGNGKSGSLLWKISGKDLVQPSYLLGTFHLKSASYLDSIPGANSALESSEQIIGELTMQDMAAMQMQMQQAMMMSSDTTYHMLYSDEDYNYVSEQLQPILGAGLDQLGVIKPSAIQLTIIMMAYQKYFPNFNPMESLDLAIQTKAIQDNKEVIGLENIDNQIYALFASSTMQRQADILLCSLKNMDVIMNDLSDQIADYDNANLNSLYQHMYDKDVPCSSTQQEIDVLLKNRNDEWMKKLPDLMKNKPSFIAVGALHLAGEEGLLHQLEIAGYKIEAIK